ncbi:hypothetical protein C7B61_06910 [filamentous cyanobacterium CCP1]|nr:hypothetical protein C7B76_17220 [filamentous cyanobacterium CCP2]PSB67296.1 hypothetical protein C7B61_06910 [filamentous cyanobacterium CCP1]
MKPLISDSHYSSLHFGSSDRQSKRPFSWKSQVHQLWHRIFEFISASSEPHVWTVQDADVLNRWSAYDPITGERIQLISEQEMRKWLEERHYQYHLPTVR